QLRAILLRLRDQWQIEKIIFRVAFLLPAIDVEVLPEVAFAIHQPDADERNAEVTGGFEMVAGQHAKAAGVDRNALVKAKFRGKIANPTVAPVTIGLVVPGRRAHVAVEVLLNSVHVRQKSVIAQQLFQPRLIDRPKKLHGTGIKLLEQVRIN